LLNTPIVGLPIFGYGIAIENRLIMTVDAPKNLGAKLRALRMRFGWTLDRMAVALGRKEPSRRSRVHEWETGSRIPSIGVLISYSRIFTISIDDMLNDQKRLDLIENRDFTEK
jgi:transcriptional regulator with XRE-family HTH domain